MTATAVPEPLSDEQREVRAMRRRRLSRLGVPYLDARLLAEETTLDLHEMERHLRRGCAPELLRRVML